MSLRTRDSRPGLLASAGPTGPQSVMPAAEDKPGATNTPDVDDRQAADHDYGWHLRQTELLRDCAAALAQTTDAHLAVDIQVLAAWHAKQAEEAWQRRTAAEGPSCLYCATPLEPKRMGRPPLFDTPACRKAWHRQNPGRKP